MSARKNNIEATLYYEEYGIVKKTLMLDSAGFRFQLCHSVL